MQVVGGGENFIIVHFSDDLHSFVAGRVSLEKFF